MNTLSSVDGAQLFHREWNGVLGGIGVIASQVQDVASALEHLHIHPEEFPALIEEYERSGPSGLPFPGFHPGEEAELAAQLGAVRAKMVDLARMHDSDHPDGTAVPVWDSTDIHVG